MNTFKRFCIENTISDSDILGILYDSEFEFNETLGFETVLTEKSETGKLKAQQWGDIKGHTDEERMQSAIEVYKKASKIAINAYDTLSKNLKTSTRRIKNPKILVDVKSEGSFVDKVLNRGKSASKINDVLRSAIIVKSEEDVTETVKRIKKDFKVVRYDFKAKGTDEEFGYFGSHHFLVEIGDINVEIQVMTRRLWAFKNEAHKIYTNFRSRGDFSKEFEKFSKRMSKQLFSLANL
jgi:ppGpp synthetase/RelA/SpoT-type nucleotidyltranferase